MLIVWRLLINAAALWAATRVVPGISYDGDWSTLFVVALVFGVINVSVRPILMLLTLPFLIITLGLFTFVLNGLMLWLTSAVSDGLGLGFTSPASVRRSSARSWSASSASCCRCSSFRVQAIDAHPTTTRDRVKGGRSETGRS